MSLVIFERYYNIGEALVAYAALEAADFHPSWHTYHRGYLNNFEQICIGGLIIHIPFSEFNDAQAWIKKLKKQPIISDENVEKLTAQNRFGPTIFAAIMTGTAFLFIAIPPLLLIWLHAQHKYKT